MAQPVWRCRKHARINPFAKVISTKWCYKRKPDRFKARVVARGFLQSPWDVGETHSNVAKLSTVRALTLRGLGYTQSHFDDCLWEYKNESENKFIFIIVFADDCLVTGDDGYIRDFMSKISKTYKIRDLGEAETFLGMEMGHAHETRQEYAHYMYLPI